MGVAKVFFKVKKLTSIAVHVVPVHVNGFGDTDITAALTYSISRMY